MFILIKIKFIITIFNFGKFNFNDYFFNENDKTAY